MSGNKLTIPLTSDPESIRAHYAVMMEWYTRLHQAIWEEIKHFSWLLSVLIGAPFAMMLKENGGQQLFFAYGWIFFLLAVVISVFAIQVIFQEGDHMSCFAFYMHRAEWALGLYERVDVSTGEPQSIVPERRTRYFLSTDTCEDFLKRNNRLRWTSVRTLFAALFGLFAIVSSGLLIWTLIKLLTR